MKITKNMLKQLIKEELQNVLSEEIEPWDIDPDWKPGDPVPRLGPGRDSSGPFVPYTPGEGEEAYTLDYNEEDDEIADQLEYYESEERRRDHKRRIEQGRRRRLARLRSDRSGAVHNFEAGKNKTIQLPDGNTIKVPVIPGEDPAKFKARVRRLMSDAASKGVPGAERRRAARTTVSEPLQEAGFQMAPGSQSPDPDLERLGRDMSLASGIGDPRYVKAIKLSTQQALDAIANVLDILRRTGDQNALALNDAELKKVNRGLKSGWIALRDLDNMLQHPGQTTKREAGRDVWLSRD